MVTRTFSSPMVNLPVVSLLLSAKSCSFFTASPWSTESANLTLDFVYSWPGCVCAAPPCYRQSLSSLA